MKTRTQNISEKAGSLKTARLELLKIHKILIDRERRAIEQSCPALTAGEFLGMLLNTPDLQWLRKFSTLIVEIDEMFDLDDGYTDEMVDDRLAAMRKLICLDETDADFAERYRNALANDSSVAAKHGELVELLTESV